MQFWPHGERSWYSAIEMVLTVVIVMLIAIELRSGSAQLSALGALKTSIQREMSQEQTAFQSMNGILSNSLDVSKQAEQRANRYAEESLRADLDAIAGPVNQFYIGVNRDAKRNPTGPAGITILFYLILENTGNTPASSIGLILVNKPPNYVNLLLDAVPQSIGAHSTRAVEVEAGSTWASLDDVQRQMNCLQCTLPVMVKLSYKTEFKDKVSKEEMVTVKIGTIPADLRSWALAHVN